MKLRELIEQVKKYEIQERNLDSEVKIVIKKPYQTIGTLPTVPVKSVQMGFDWETGIFMIYPEEGLTQHDVDFAEKFRQLENKYGKVHNENIHLQSEIKRLRKIINTLASGDI